MKFGTKISVYALAVFTYAAAVLPSACAQDSSGDSGAEAKRFTVGLRARELPLRQFGTLNNRTDLFTITTPSPVRDYQFETSSHSPRWGAGLALDYAFGDARWTLSAEAMLSKLSYNKLTTIALGSDDPTTVNDERPHMFINEDNRASLIDLPVMIHHRGLKAAGPFSKVYVGAGATLRSAINVHSTTTTTFADTTTSTSNYLVAPAHRNVVGAVAGMGLRIVDDFKLTWTPEIRYTRWMSSTFSADSTVSPRNQLEISMGFTF